MTGEMILHPEYDALRAEAERLRDELARLVAERDLLLFHTVPDLESDYMVKIGSFELKAYEIEIQAQRLRRKIALIQAQLNRGLPVRLDEIEARLDRELAGYQRHLVERLAAMDAALKMRESMVLLSERDAAELRKLYRQAVKALHPDLHAGDDPADAERRAQLFAHAMAAYRNGDIHAMRTVILLMEDLVPATVTMELIDELRAKVEMLTGLCAEIRDEIDVIRGSFPCDIAELLKDDAWVASQVQRAQTLIATCRERCARLEERLAGMMEASS